MKFVHMPNLPEDAAAVIVSPHCGTETIAGLERLGVKVILGYDSRQPVEAINGHPDTNIIHMGDNNFVCSPASYEYYKKVLGKYGANIITGEKSGEGKYPLDVAYNAAIVGKYIIHNFKYTEKKLLNFGYIPIDVEQGYSKCSVCVIDENAIITDDEGIANKAQKYNIFALLISKGDVRLENLNYGFFGGSCGKIGKNVLVVNGNLNFHKDYVKIRNFAEKFGIECVNTVNSVIKDIGTVIPVSEKNNNI